MHRTIQLAISSAVFSLILVGCGAGSPGASVPGDRATPSSPDEPGTGSPAAAIDSCTLLSDDEIEGATGKGVSQRTPSTLTQVFSSVCDVDLDGGGSLTVSVLSSGGRQMYENSFEPFIGEGEVLDEAVAGLGDKAARAGDDNLMVLRDDVLFDIFYIDFARRDKWDAVFYLSEVALAKLPCLADGCPGFSPPPPPSRAPEADVCALLTDAEIEQATGYRPLGKESATAIDPSCTWRLDTDLDLDFIEISVIASGGREPFDFVANQMFEDPPEHIPGLGDDAVKTATIPGGAVYAIVGDTLVTLRFSLPLSVADPYSLVVPLLEAALPRL